MIIRPLIGRLATALFRWKPEGSLPSDPRFVLIAAPHTSNWDFFFFLAISWGHYKVQPNWMGKAELFRGWRGPIMRALGGVSVKRDRRNNLVQQLAEKFATSPKLILTVPAEGTRGKREYWKSGFYRIAEGAKVPIVPGFLDYARRRGGFGPSFVPTGDMKADMDRLRAFYKDIQGKFPEKFTLPRLPEEDGLSVPSAG